MRLFWRFGITRQSTFFETVLRSTDLFHFQLEFINFEPPGSAPVLKRASSGRAFIVLRFPPQHIAEQARRVGAGSPSLPYRAFASCASRVAFEVPASVREIPFHLDAILHHLTQWEPYTGPISGIGLATVVEFPDRVLLIPETSATARPQLRTTLVHEWATATDPARWTPIWHTRLHTERPSRNQETAASAWVTTPTRLRAVQNNLDRDRFPQDEFSTLTRAQRQQIVANCKQFGASIVADDFILTALGATAQLKSDWPGAGLSLRSWQHDSVLGRDQYVETVEAGYLVPFGHKATRTRISQREISDKIAGLIQHDVITVQEPERRYDGEVERSYRYGGREMPFKSISIATPHHLPQSDGALPKLEVTAIDISGHEVTFAITMYFITVAELAEGSKLNELAGRFKGIPLMGQRVTLAAYGEPGNDTDAAVAEMDFGVLAAGGLDPPFLPVTLLREHDLGAKISLPAIEHLLGAVPGSVRSLTPALVRMSLHELYLNSDRPNPKRIFAAFDGTLPALRVPAERAGGVAAPTFPPIEGLSSILGPVAQIRETLADQTINPLDAARDTKLLGVIRLADLLEAVKPTSDGPPLANLASLYDDLDRLPEAVTISQPILSGVRVGSDFETRFLWKPKIRRNLPGLIAAGGGGALSLIMKGRVRKTSNSADAFHVEGVLKNFKLTFASMLEVDFNRLAFKSSPGKKMQVDLQIARFDFLSGGDLSFVKTIEPILRLLSVGGPGGGLAIEPRPDGVVLRASISVQSFGTGAMNLENIALSSTLSLPFVEGTPAAVRFAVSERSKPFLVSVLPLGGTGFFALEVRTDTSVHVEAAIEFGGILAINLLEIVKGGVYAFAGVYVSIEKNDATTRIEITAFVRWGGYASVLGIVSVSIEFSVALTYDPSTRICKAAASVIVGVQVAMFEETFSFTVEKTILNFGDLPIDEVTMVLSSERRSSGFVSLVSESQWEQYCRAFASLQQR